MIEKRFSKDLSVQRIVDSTPMELPIIEINQPKIKVEQDFEAEFVKVIKESENLLFYTSA